MKNKKKYIFIGLISLVFVVSVYLIHPSVLRTPPLSKGGENANTENTNLLRPSLVKVEVNKEKESQIEVKPLSEKNIKVTLNVLDKTYATNIKNGATVYDVMKGVQGIKENNFSFKYRETIGLGNFITEINDTKGTPGKYWIYYVNDIKAPVGASQYILKEGDIISWKQEGN